MLQLPKIGRPPEAHYSICQASQMVGKTVAKVEFGFRENIEGVHGSELLIVHFTDGSILSIDTGSNAGNLAHQHEGLKENDFHVDLSLHWVPA
ncbi:MAG: hypothetical protein A3J28_15810 [Acidobacteria bacterium RIFCSPLOWO2_12_FULL_60_22]|nr:MAG: hypothetical protein A3J28_15810 [Acidobacteria bacterium RIFCSPLOWO2_12_FULL_60_22]